MFANLNQVIILARIEAAIGILLGRTQLVFLLLVEHLLALTDHVREELACLFHFLNFFFQKCFLRTLMTA